MTKHKIVLFLILVLFTNISMASDLSSYLPQGIEYDPKIPTPESVLEHGVGEKHARHDLLLAYFRLLAQSSRRVTYQEIGRTFENRAQVLLTISSAENIVNIDNIQAQRQQLKRDVNQDSKVVVWLGYSIHGDEASGTNASLLTAYHLAAAKGKEIEDSLDNMIVIIDPSLNPDGYNRFSQWVTSNSSKNLVADPVNREHRQNWPGGRTNHYWFDLNRDWLLAQQPESKSRLKHFHLWKPNIMNDHHEMGSTSTYFFQPGIVNQQNPLTPQANFELTAKIAKHHADLMDANGRMYYTKESFDDFYIGKGSTYPDINGSIGILYEQASVRGHLVDNDYGEFELAYAIKNHFLTSLSTLEAAQTYRLELLNLQKDFYANAIKSADKDKQKAFVFSTDGDPGRSYHLIDLLLRHKIEIYKLAKSFKSDVETFSTDNSYIIPLQQDQYLLIKSLFEERKEFDSNAFYDVSAWSMQHTFNLPFARLSRAQYRDNMLGEKIDQNKQAQGNLHGDSSIAYVFSWDNYNASPVLYALLKDEIKVQVATKTFEFETLVGPRRFSRGSIIVPVGIQTMVAAGLKDRLGQLANKNGIDIFPIKQGLAFSGTDLGSPSNVPLKIPKPVMVTGRGVASTDAGEVWQLLDQHLNIPLTMVDMDLFKTLRLQDYTHLIMVSGNYNLLDKQIATKVKSWIEQGGVLVATKSATQWVAKNEIVDVDITDRKTLDEEKRYGKDEKKKTNGSEKKEKGNNSEKEEDKKLERYPYADNKWNRDNKIIGGSIAVVDLDNTHPLGYGYQERQLATLKRGTVFMSPSKEPIETVAQYTEEPLLAGFVSKENIEEIAGSAMLIAKPLGKGVVVLMVDNPNFRAVWYGTSKLFINSLFFSSVIKK